MKTQRVLRRIALGLLGAALASIVLVTAFVPRPRPLAPVRVILSDADRKDIALTLYEVAAELTLISEKLRAASQPRFGNAIVFIQGSDEKWRPVRARIIGDQNGARLAELEDGSRVEVPDGAVGWDTPPRPESHP